MFIRLLRSKLHRATVTATDLDYHGSVTIDCDILDAAGILPYEVVTVGNLATGQRAETYVLPGPAGGGDVQMNGAMARLAQPGDKLILFTFAYLEPSEAANHKPRIIVLDDENRIAERWDG